MGILTKQIKIAAVDGSMVIQTIRNKSITDFEDGLEYYAAQAVKCQCIVTEDNKDFFFSDLEVLTAQSFLEKYVMGKVFS